MSFSTFTSWIEMHEIPLSEEVMRSWGFNHCGMSIAIVVSILDWDEDRDQVVADDEENEKKDAVADEHIKKGESKS